MCVCVCVCVCVYVCVCVCLLLLAQEPSSEARGQLTNGCGTVSGCSDLSMDPGSSHVEALLGFESELSFS